MAIEQLGFYLTREGKLRRVICILTGLEEYPVIATNADGEPDTWESNGSYSNRSLATNKIDLVRYLPTVKSFDDPIPPETANLNEGAKHSSMNEYPAAICPKCDSKIGHPGHCPQCYSRNC